MAENSKIEWTDHTFNPWEGCTKVSPGCAHCYAEARNNRFGGGNWGKGKPRRRTSAANWKQPLKWDRESHINRGLVDFPDRPHRRRVFCASLADWLDDEVPPIWRFNLFELIWRTQNLDWLLLTKRPENWRKAMKDARNAATVDFNDVTDRIDAWLSGESIPFRNIQVGTSVEDQPRADQRISELLKIPALVRFLSVEPMLGPIQFANSFWSVPGTERVHWAIFGGESGPGARPCHADWIREGVRQCRNAGIKPFVKQLGAHACLGVDDSQIIRDKKGGDMSEWPEDLRVREFPC